MKKLIIFAAVAAIAAGVQADSMTWGSTLGGGDGTTFNVNNNWWSDDDAGLSTHVPGAGDVVYIDDDLFGNSLSTMPTLSAAQTIAGLLIGDGSAGAVDINTGADLTVNGWMYVGGVSGSSTLNMNGGVADVENLLWATRDAAGSGHINLYGGVITTAAMSMTGDGTGTMDITEGSIVVTGAFDGGGWDFLTASGFITAYGGTGTVMRDFNAGTGQTTLYAIPEPATLGLVALLGGGILWIRSRFMI